MHPIRFLVSKYREQAQIEAMWLLIEELEFQLRQRDRQIRQLHQERAEREGFLDRLINLGLAMADEAITLTGKLHRQEKELKDLKRAIQDAGLTAEVRASLDYNSAFERMSNTFRVQFMQ